MKVGIHFTFELPSITMTTTIRLLIFTALLAVAASQGFGNFFGGGGSGNRGGGGIPGLSTLTDTASKVTNLFTKQFGDFKNKFQKTYSSPEEEKQRLSIFSQNQESILNFNKVANLPYTLKINEYADLLTSEFNKLLNGLIVDRSKTHATKYVHDKAAKLPENVDWRKEGVIGPVRTQGSCASCYAFAATSAIESYLSKKGGVLHQLSPQNVVDCTIQKPYENHGCASGAADPSFDYIKDHGINTESSYPYEGKAGGQCKFSSESSVGTIKDYVILDEGDDKGLQEVLATKGPVLVGIDAHATSFQLYGGGVYYEPQCGSSINDLNHAVLVVGYGVDPNGDKYWLVRNTYGTGWGEDGYIKIARNVTNHCGISTYALYPVV